MSKTKPTRGGKRKGAGRKPSPGGRKKFGTLGCSADAESVAYVTELAKSRGQTLGEFVRNAVWAHVALHGAGRPMPF